MRYTLLPPTVKGGIKVCFCTPKRLRLQLSQLFLHLACFAVVWVATMLSEIRGFQAVLVATFTRSAQSGKLLLANGGSIQCQRVPNPRRLQLLEFVRNAVLISLMTFRHATSVAVHWAIPMPRRLSRPAIPRHPTPQLRSPVLLLHLRQRRWKVHFCLNRKRRYPILPVELLILGLVTA
jgi:hypothetical protein